MPTYDYECEKCGKRFEIKRGFHEEGEVSCPKCKGKSRQVFSPTPIIFKGSGFYVTDSRKKEAPEAVEPAKSETSKTQGKTETVDTKPKTGTEAPAKTSSEKAPKPKADK